MIVAVESKEKLIKCSSDRKNYRLIILSPLQIVPLHNDNLKRSSKVRNNVKGKLLYNRRRHDFGKI